MRNRENKPGAFEPILGERLLLVIVLVLTASVFLPTLRFQFVYDDQGQIVDNPFVHTWHYVPLYFQGHVWQSIFPMSLGNYYRPFNVLWFRINDALFGLRPWGWHAGAIGLHMFATGLVYAIVWQLTGDPLLAATTALLFGIHPTRHEVVAWVSGTTESLCAMFFLSSFLAYLKSHQRWTIGWMSVSCILYAAGLLAKETAIVLPALVLAHGYLYGARTSEIQPQRWRRFLSAALRASVYVPLAILYVVVRIIELHGFSHPQSEVPLSTVLMTLPSVWWFYLKQWFLPIHLSEFYDVPFRTHWDLLHVALPLAVFGMIGLALWYFRRRLTDPAVSFGVLALIVPLLPVFYLSAFRTGELVHDRYLYLPGLGAALLVALALRPLFRGPLVFGVPRGFAVVLLGLIIPLAYSTANASRYWQNDDLLFDQARLFAPENTTVQNNYALNLARNGDMGTAISDLQKLVHDHPDYQLGSYNLGRLLYQMNMLGAAEHYLLQARNLSPDYPNTYLDLGLVYLKSGRRDEAEVQFRRAVSLRPLNPRYHYALGLVFSLRQNCPLARAEFGQALVLDPELHEASEQMDKCSAGAKVSSGPVGAGQLPAAGRADQGSPLSPRQVSLPLVPVNGP